MYKKSITYTDYNGNERTEGFYFNMSQSEAVKLNAKYPGGITEAMTEAVQSQDGQKIIDFFEELVAVSYGKKTPDGRRFIKSQEVLDEFRQCPAYDIFFMELVTNSEEASNFFNGIIPQIPVDNMAANATEPNTAPVLMPAT